MIEVELIVDESGSMAGIKDDTLKGLEAYFNELRKDKSNEYVVSVTTFNTNVKQQFTKRPLNEVSMNHIFYNPNGGTALLDAIGSRMQNYNFIRPAYTDPNPREVIDAITGERFLAQKVIDESKNKHIIVIVTDGEENSSHSYQLNKVKELIESKQGLDNWAFVFMGADPSLWQGAQAMGIADGYIVRNANKHWGTPMIMYAAAARGTSTYASGATSSLDIGSAVADAADDIAGTISAN